jgi:Tfp pilus assembly protein PilF
VANPTLLYQYAVLNLAAERHDAYRATCAQIVEIAQQTGDPNQANTAAWVCALAPRAVDDLDTCVALAAAVLKEKPKDYALLNTHAAILVRAGRHQDALQQFDTAIAAHGKGGTAMDWLFQALARLEAGETAAARKLVEQSAEWLKKLEAGQLEDSSISTPLSWSDRVEFRSLLKEARSRIERQEGLSRSHRPDSPSGFCWIPCRILWPLTSLYSTIIPEE